jgi:hypothetical protein
VVCKIILNQIQCFFFSTQANANFRNRSTSQFSIRIKPLAGDVKVLEQASFAISVKPRMSNYGCLCKNPIMSEISRFLSFN